MSRSRIIIIIIIIIAVVVVIIITLPPPWRNALRPKNKFPCVGQSAVIGPRALTARLDPFPQSPRARGIARGFTGFGKDVVFPRTVLTSLIAVRVVLLPFSACHSSTDDGRPTTDRQLLPSSDFLVPIKFVRRVALPFRLQH